MKKKLLPIFLSLVLFFGLCADLAAQYVYTASSRLNRTQEARVPKNGSLTFYNHLDFFTAADGYKITGIESIAQWIVRNSVHLDYGVTDNILLAVNPTIYQDIHYFDSEANTPVDNVIVTAKFGSFGFGNEYFYAGLMANVLIPVANRRNSYGNPYTAGGTELGLNLLLSYYADNLFPQESFGVHLNLGYYNYFDNGKNISNRNEFEYIVESATSSFNYSIGIKYPTAFVDLMLEFWGNSFIRKPPEIAYTRENLSFVTVGFRIKPLNFVSVSLTGDVLVSGREDETTYDGSYSILPQPAINPQNYAPWRIALGIQLNILPVSYFSTGDPRNVDLNPENQGSDVIRKLEDINEDKETTARKVEELRKRRQDVEKNLNQLKQILKEGEPAPAPSTAPTAPPPVTPPPSDSSKTTPK
ncbi:MAG: hypothetical protein IAF08_02570 [Rhizobacter sp.]|nr:hypothetical protein [Chlorobiales bacterium]